MTVSNKNSLYNYMAVILFHPFIRAIPSYLYTILFMASQTLAVKKAYHVYEFDELLKIPINISNSFYKYLLMR